MHNSLSYELETIKSTPNQPNSLFLLILLIEKKMEYLTQSKDEETCKQQFEPFYELLAVLAGDKQITEIQKATKNLEDKILQAIKVCIESLSQDTLHQNTARFKSLVQNIKDTIDPIERLCTDIAYAVESLVVFPDIEKKKQQRLNDYSMY